MKYLIFGKNGWIAGKLNNFLNSESKGFRAQNNADSNAEQRGIIAEISDVDITDLQAIRKELNEKKPEIVINAAGITGRPNIDWCEEHKLETIAGNVTGPLNILQACSEKNIYWVHFGSGCVFQGAGNKGKGWKENDKANPPSFYSWTKYWADSILRHFPMLIVRLRLPIDIKPSQRNLINKLLEYSQVIDTQNSVTIIPDLLEATKKLIDKRKTGIFHVTNPGTISPSEIMELYQKEIDSNHKFKIISEQDLYKKDLAKAVRSNCVLSTDKLQAEGIKLKPIKQRIKEVIKEYKKNLINE